MERGRIFINGKVEHFTRLALDQRSRVFGPSRKKAVTARSIRKNMVNSDTQDESTFNKIELENGQRDATRIVVSVGGMQLFCCHRCGKNLVSVQQ